MLLIVLDWFLQMNTTLSNILSREDSPGKKPVQAVLGFSHPWLSDQGDGTYCNPVLYADYSDPDATRVGDDFFLTASSFHCTPGLPILHSQDLVNWTLIGHALKNLPHPRYVKFNPAAACGRRPSGFMPANSGFFIPHRTKAFSSLPPTIRPAYGLSHIACRREKD